jgi:hypothetical protein
VLGDERRHERAATPVAALSISGPENVAYSRIVPRR